MRSRKSAVDWLTNDSPAVWMKMTAFLLTLFAYIVRLAYLRRLPRPLWTVKGYVSSQSTHGRLANTRPLTLSAGGDFHDPHPPPQSAALPHPDQQEHPPTWESLDINTPAVAAEEKLALEEEREYYEEILRDTQRVSELQAQATQQQQRGFAV